MSAAKRIRDLGVTIGDAPPGETNSIVDVPGVRVGHVDLRGGPREAGGKPIHTGVSVIVPGTKNLAADPLPAAVHVFNGYGKSTGIMQINELGRLESPIFLCSTLSVGRVWDAAASILMDQNPGATSLNPAVFECNDGSVNDARGRHATEADVRRAYENASSNPPAMGAVGAGSGMRAFGRTAGIGSASRIVKTPALGEVRVGVLTLNNFAGRLQWRGKPIAPPPEKIPQPPGSIIVVLAIDAPLGAMILRRLAARAWGGVARIGSTFAHGSGDIAVAFSLPQADGTCPDRLLWRLDEKDLSPLFIAAADATEESIWDCLLAGEEVSGADLVL
jgi:D-aminopeptidase